MDEQEERRAFAEDEWYDDDDDGSIGSENYDDPMDSIFVNSFGEATEYLESSVPIRLLSLFPSFDEDEEEGEEEDGDIDGGTGNDARSVRRFMAALRQRRGGRRSIEAIHIHEMESESLVEEELERLCRDVLPVHPTLETVSLTMPPQYGAILASSLRAESRMRVLQLCGAIDRGTVQAITDMIARRDGPSLLTRLHVFPYFGPRLDDANCNLICQAVSGNSNLRKLILLVGRACGGALEGAVAPSSPLRTLDVYLDDVSDDCVSSFAQQLRTNTTLERLTLCVWSNDFSGRPSPFLGPIAEALENYNVTLRRVRFVVGHPSVLGPGEAEEVRVVNHYIRRNRRIRRALEQLEPLSYHISPTNVWPQAFEMVNSLPTLLYRFLRRGNVQALCDVLLPPEKSTSCKKRARAIDNKNEDDHEDDVEG